MVTSSESKFKWQTMASEEESLIAAFLAGEPGAIDVLRDWYDDRGIDIRPVIRNTSSAEWFFRRAMRCETSLELHAALTVEVHFMNEIEVHEGREYRANTFYGIPPSHYRGVLSQIKGW